MSRGTERKPTRRRAGRGPGATAVIVALIATGCTTTPAPFEQVGTSNAAMARADMAGASELAPVEMGAAREKSKRRDVAMAAKDYRHALWFAQEAQVDAELAEVRVRSAKAMRALDAAGAAQATQAVHHKPTLRDAPTRNTRER